MITPRFWQASGPTAFGRHDRRSRASRIGTATAFSGRWWPACDFMVVRLDAAHSTQQVPPVTVRTFLSQPLAALCRRLLWAMMAVAVLIGAPGMTRRVEAASIMPAAAHAEATARIQNGAASPAPNDHSGSAIADHATCGAHVVAPPRSETWSAAPQASSARFEVAGQPALRPGLPTPPAEPPRT